MSTTIVLATGNAGKVRELGQLLSGSAFDIRPQSEYGVPEAEETGLTFVENAILKARNAAAHTGLPAIADDSGIEVDALMGAPGVRSARYAGPAASDADNLNKLLDALSAREDAPRTARFRCLMVYLRHAEDPAPLICAGVWEGEIATAPRGTNGFGYDPVFWLPDRGCTAAELDSETKNRLSHRGQALRELVARLTG
ncbi:MAG: RdgB/HAM1 family non-canonical purine NTP pyrophosphatase [Chromatiales bacterium]|nr:RdgB/HAM1 family non-canonical purine NTP pyrophosphatase [Chromatiales bacterium]